MLLVGAVAVGSLRSLTSSNTQHRAQVLSRLSAQGVPTPDLDYVLLLGEQRAGSS